jgi:hypothetical protein
VCTFGSIAKLDLFRSWACILRSLSTTWLRISGTVLLLTRQILSKRRRARTRKSTNFADWDFLKRVRSSFEIRSFFAAKKISRFAFVCGFYSFRRITLEFEHPFPKLPSLATNIHEANLTTSTITVTRTAFPQRNYISIKTTFSLSQNAPPNMGKMNFAYHQVSSKQNLQVHFVSSIGFVSSSAAPSSNARADHGVDEAFCQTPLDSSADDSFIKPANDDDEKLETNKDQNPNETARRKTKMHHSNLDIKIIS